MSLFRTRRVKLLLLISTVGFIFFSLPNSLLRSSHSSDSAKPTHSQHPQHPFAGNFSARPVRKPPVVLGKHKYRPDGLLEVNQDGPHPIYELIARAEKEWEAKLARASTTLEDAVKEYKRRYNRSPPKGFDRW